MSRFPTLSSMGVCSFDQVSRYTLHSDSGDDELKIYYHRPDNSPLPRSKKFRFSPSNGDSSPLLTQAIDELNQLTAGAAGAQPTRQQLATELEQLEQVVLSKVDELRRQLNSWD